MTEPRRPSILVVDDDVSNLAVVASVLQANYHLRLVANAERALSLAKATPPDLVLLDVEMPDLDGYAVCERLKADPALEEVPVIFLTGRASVDDEALGFARGAVDYIHKPLSPPILVARVRTHLALRDALEAERVERARAAALLEVVMPSSVAEELGRTGTVAPRRVENVAVLFCDLVGFTAYCDKHSPEEVVSRLDLVLHEFERVARAHGVEKLKTIGDGFLASAGIFDARGASLERAVRCGVELARSVPKVCPGWAARVGVDEGTLVSGIVGGERFQFDIWGRPVDLAMGLAGAGRPGAVCVTQRCREKLGSCFAVESLGTRAVGALGEFEVFEVG